MEEVDELNPGVAIILSGGGGCDAGCVFRREMWPFSDSAHSDVSPTFLEPSLANIFNSCWSSRAPLAQ